MAASVGKHALMTTKPKLYEERVCWMNIKRSVISVYPDNYVFKSLGNEFRNFCGITKFLPAPPHSSLSRYGFCTFRQQEKLRMLTYRCKSYLAHHRAVRQVYFLENTERCSFILEEPYRILHDIKQFGVKAVKGGFRRRPELIRQKEPNCITDVKSYGLYDKCERIQQELTEKILKLMNVKKEGVGDLMLDIGCGHGWSLTIPCWNGFCVTGIDLDLQALSVIQNKINTNYLTSQNVHVVRMDASNGLGFKENTFDLAISISFLQWLCVGKHSDKTLQRFFDSLSYILKPGGKAGIQFYPRNVGDVDNMISQAQKYFKGALVSDFPHLDRGRKLFLVLVNNK